MRAACARHPLIDGLWRVLEVGGVPLLEQELTLVCRQQLQLRHLRRGLGERRFQERAEVPEHPLSGIRLVEIRVVVELETQRAVGALDVEPEVGAHVGGRFVVECKDDLLRWDRCPVLDRSVCLLCDSGERGGIGEIEQHEADLPIARDQPEWHLVGARVAVKQARECSGQGAVSGEGCGTKLAASFGSAASETRPRLPVATDGRRWSVGRSSVASSSAGEDCTGAGMLPLSPDLSFHARLESITSQWASRPRQLCTIVALALKVRSP